MKFIIRDSRAVSTDRIKRERIVQLKKAGFKVYKENKKYYIEIDSLEHLMQLQKEVKEELIVDDDSIQIYDNFIE